MEITQVQLEALCELINIGVGQAANVLNTMLESHIKLQVPFLKVLTKDELLEEIKQICPERLAVVDLHFKGLFSGKAELIFPVAGASRLVEALVGDIRAEQHDIDSIRQGTICEVGNIVINAIMGSISNVLKTNFQYSVPLFAETVAEQLLSSNQQPSEVILLARTRFQIERLEIEGDLLIYFALDAFDAVLKAIDRFLVF